MKKGIVICFILGIFAAKIHKYYKTQSFNTPEDVQTLKMLQEAQNAEGLASIEYRAGYDWARKYQIVNPEWCANQDKDGDFLIGCEDYALEQSIE